MSASREGPYFNLKAVVQQTGLKPDTLRAWERRYGLPQPQRSSGGHRLYSLRDIDIVKWLMARQREGLSIKRGVQLWERLEADGTNPLETPTSIAPTAAPAPATHIVGETILQLRADWIAACLAYDEQRAEQVLSEAFALFGPEAVCLQLLQEAMAEIGEGWYRGDVTVQQEHFCSALATRRLESLVMASPPPTRPGRILAACPPQEEHIFGLLLLTFLLRRRGWDVVYLGANVPAEKLEMTVAATNPQMVLLAAQQLHTAATLLEIAQLLQQQGTHVAYGGLIFNLLPALRGRIPGHFLGEELHSAFQTAEILMAARRSLPAVEAASESYRQARDHYRERAGLIGAQLLQMSGVVGSVFPYLPMANRQMAVNIGAALTLGDMGYLGTDIHWLKGLLSNHQLPADALPGYLASYYLAARDNLDERGEPILTWFESVIQWDGEE